MVLRLCLGGRLVGFGVVLRPVKDCFFFFVSFASWKFAALFGSVLGCLWGWFVGVLRVLFGGCFGGELRWVWVGFCCCFRGQIGLVLLGFSGRFGLVLDCSKCAVLLQFLGELRTVVGCLSLIPLAENLLCFEILWVKFGVVLRSFMTRFGGWFSAEFRALFDSYLSLFGGCFEMGFVMVFCCVLRAMLSWFWSWLKVFCGLIKGWSVPSLFCPFVVFLDAFWNVLWAALVLSMGL